MKHAQLADLLRPTDLDGIVGQDHLFGISCITQRVMIFRSGRAEVRVREVCVHI